MNTTKIAQINTSCGVGSTGKIAVSISELLTQNGIENEILFSTATNGYEKGIYSGAGAEIPAAGQLWIQFPGENPQNHRGTRAVLTQHGAAA